MKKSILLAAMLALAGCASTCAPNDTQCQQNADSTAEAVGAGVGAALDILDLVGDVKDPSTTTTETRTCTKDRRGNETCTTTKQNSP